MRSRLWYTHIACGHVSAWALAAFLGSEFIRPLGTLSSSYCSNLPHRGVPAISAPHLPSLSISLPFIFKSTYHLSTGHFLLTSEATSSSERETYRLRAPVWSSSICVCQCVPSLQAGLSSNLLENAYPTIWKREAKWLRGEGASTRFGTKIWIQITILALIMPHWVKYITFRLSFSNPRSGNNYFMVSSALRKCFTRA